jgi:hypothetical protein
MIMNRLLLTMVPIAADHCIDLNDHGRSRGAAIPGSGGSRLAVVVTVAKGYDLGYIWRTKPSPARRARPAAATSTPPRPTNRPAADLSVMLFATAVLLAGLVLQDYIMVTLSPVIADEQQPSSFPYSPAESDSIGGEPPAP